VSLQAISIFAQALGRQSCALSQYKKKKDRFATKFEATADLERKKRELAKEKFARAFGNIDYIEPEKPRNED